MVLKPGLLLGGSQVFGEISPSAVRVVNGSYDRLYMQLDRETRVKADF